MTQPQIEPSGLSGQEAALRLGQFGPNAIPERRVHPLRALAAKLWGPVPWMLELAFILELGLGKYPEAIIVGVLLLLNAALSYSQEGRAHGALALLRRKLKVNARVKREGVWQLLAAEQLVPGDWVHLRMGDLVPADVRLHSGALLLDQSALTGESAPVEAGPDAVAFSGSTIRRGEASGEVISTGKNSFFGKTVELVQLGKAPSGLETMIFAIVRYLMVLGGALIAAVAMYSWAKGLPWTEVLPFALILLLASVPVALPATFALATALGSQELARRGVLVTRLAAIEEAAAMDVLASDKTGTLTQNRLHLSSLLPYPPYQQDELLHLAALASDEATQDPLDLAVLEGLRNRGLQAGQRLEFIPFDPASKRSEARFVQGDQVARVLKGAVPVLAELTGNTRAVEDAEQLAGQGMRVLAVAKGFGDELKLVGLLGLADPPRPDSPSLIERLQQLGVRILMVTGDSAPTAQAVARQLGLGERVGSREALESAEALMQRDAFAGLYPEDKFRLVQTLQGAGHVVGMTGDGVNDAPALKQAQVGIAVESATDVAKAAASLVLTTPGLSGIVAAVEEGRRIYQRMLSYTLNKIVKTLEIGLFLGLGLLVFGVFVTTPKLVLLLFFTNDLVTMSLASDRVGFSKEPDRWDIRKLMGAALVLAVGWLVFSFSAFWVGREVLHLNLPQLQTLVFLLLVFDSQATVYIVRERSFFWRSRPSSWLLVGSLFDLGLVVALAGLGWLMTPIPLNMILGLLVAVLAYMFLLDGVKVWLFRRLNLR
ncbi:MAG: plasma-membrane proton-efflux P-type ATPase [Thermaceae bacterium]|nr:plasma-membrane proton-efflux P-type ATPase [Thermaceae bacterium]